MGVTFFFDWVWVGVTFFWLGVGGCDLFWMGVGRCDLFLAGCGWVWVSARFITAQNLSKFFFLPL